MPAGELVDLSVPVLKRHAAVRSVDATLEEGPEGLNAIGLDIGAHGLALAVVDRFVGPTRVDGALVGVDLWAPADRSAP